MYTLHLRICNSQRFSTIKVELELESEIQYEKVQYKPIEPNCETDFIIRPEINTLLPPARRLCFCLGLFIGCEFVCEQDNSKTYGRIFMKFSGYV